MLTNVRSRRKLHRSSQGPMARSHAQVYYDLARASGGQAIEVSKSDLSLATSIIEDSSASARVGQQRGKPYLTAGRVVLRVGKCAVSFLFFSFQVTVFQVLRNPGRPDVFTFTVDGSLQNMTAYITGASSLTFNLTSPSGVVISMVPPLIVLSTELL